MNNEAEEIFNETEIEFWYPECGNVCVSCAFFPNGMKAIHYHIIKEDLQFDEVLAQKALEKVVKRFIASRLESGVRL